MADELAQLTEEVPEEQSEQGEMKQGDYSGPKGNGDLPEPLVKALETICRKMDQRELQPRINQVANRQKNRLFWRNQQYLMKEQDQGVGGVTIYKPIKEGDDGYDEESKVYNIYAAFGKPYIAAYSQTPCGVRFEPNDFDVASDVDAAKEAESARRLIAKLNDQKDIQAEIAKYNWTDGVVVLETENCDDEPEKLGTDESGNARPYPKITVGGLLEWKVPIASGPFKKWDYARHQQEFSYTTLKEEYPDKAEKIQTSIGGSSKDIDYSRQARMSCAEGLGLQTQSGDALAFQSTKSRYYLRPSAFREIEDKTLQSELKDWFPSGAYVEFAGETYVCSCDRSMDKHLSAFKTIKGDGWNMPGIGDGLIPIQETFNTLMNLGVDGIRRTIPHKYLDQKLLSPDAIKEQKSEYGHWHPVEKTPGEALGDHFFEESPVQFPPELTELVTVLSDALPGLVSGVNRALLGGEMGEAGKTAAGYSQMLNQALAQMGLSWVPFKKAWATTIQQSVKLLPSAYDDGSTLSTGASDNGIEGERITVNVDNLKGQFLTYPDTDESFPESWAMKKATFTNLMMGADKNPALGAILTHPDNLRLAKDLVGIPDLTIPGADSDEKQMREIEEMENQAPVPDPQAIQPEMQQNIPLTSSVDVDPDCDDHQTEFATCLRWINSAAGQKAKREKPDWFQNVRMHAMKHKQFIQQQGQQNKPPSESIQFKDLPPKGQVQMAQQAGIQLDENDVALKQAAEMAAKNKPVQPGEKTNA